MVTASQRPSRLFVYLVFATALLTLGLIVFGAVVRVTDSGLGCGSSWPLCDGSIFPPLDNVTAWIEWLHRLFAALIGLFGIATLVVAIRAYRNRNRLALNATVIAAVLFFVQSMLGALVVVWDLPPTAVTLHLGTAMLLLAALLVGGVAAVHRPAQRYARDNFTLLVYLTAALAFVIILTGALVRGAGASLACTDWPLCNGSLIPLDQGQGALIHWLHRVSVLGLGVTLGLVAWQAWRTRGADVVRNLAVAAAAAYLMQAGIGAMYVFTAAAPWTGAAHVGLAGLTWGLLVALSTVETINTSEKRDEATWELHSGALTN
jgi:heme A synthase